VLIEPIFDKENDDDDDDGNEIRIVIRSKETSQRSNAQYSNSIWNALPNVESKPPDLQ
jgi:hypothetical protein